MTGKEIRLHIRAQPFRPFALELIDGRRIPVLRPDLIFVSPNGRTIHVYQPDNNYTLTDCDLVRNIDLPAPIESHTTKPPTADPKLTIVDWEKGDKVTAEEIRSNIVALPFRPFMLRLADGRQVPVLHREFILVSPKGRLVDVFQPDDSHSIIDVHYVVGIDFPAPIEAPQVPPTNGP